MWVDCPNLFSVYQTNFYYCVDLQIQILSKIIHPHVISLIGVCLKPKAMLVLEYAELGSLSSMKPYSSFNTVLKHRITIQVCYNYVYLQGTNKLGGGLFVFVFVFAGLFVCFCRFQVLWLFFTKVALYTEI